MNKRLDSALETARRTLSEDAQEELAALVEGFISWQALDSAPALTDDEGRRVEGRLDAAHPRANAADYDSWLRAKITRAMLEADAKPGRRTSLADMRAKFDIGD